MVKTTPLESMVNMLVGKFQPSILRTKKKEGLVIFNEFYFSDTNKEVLNEVLANRLLTGENKKMGLIHTIGVISKKDENKLQHSSKMALSLLVKLLDENRHKNSKVFQKVFCSYGEDDYKEMKLYMHSLEGDKTEANIVKNYVNNRAAYTKKVTELLKEEEEEKKIKAEELKTESDKANKSKLNERRASSDGGYLDGPNAPIARQESMKWRDGGQVETRSKPQPVKSIAGSDDSMSFLEKLAAFFSGERSSKSELEERGVLKKGNYYSVPLGNVRKNDEGIPLLIVDLVRILRKPEHLKTQGIFRLSGGSGEVQEIKRCYDFEDNPHAAADLDTKDVHAVAGALKLYLRELPEPLLSYELYDEFVAKWRDGRSDKISSLVEKLDSVTQLTWAYLLDVIAEVSLHSGVNMMTAKNLAIVFAPNILRLKVETFDRIARDTPVTVSLVEHMINEVARKKSAELKPAEEGTDATAEIKIPATTTPTGGGVSVPGPPTPTGGGVTIPGPPRPTGGGVSVPGPPAPTGGGVTVPGPPVPAAANSGIVVPPPPKVVPPTISETAALAVPGATLLVPGPPQKPGQDSMNVKHTRSLTGFSDTEEKEWEEHYDSASGHKYYYNKKTGSTQWTAPSDFS